MAGYELQSWVWAANLRTLMEYLSVWTWYVFDDWDWGEIVAGLRGTDPERADRWYRFRLDGSPEVHVAMAEGRDGQQVAVRVTGPLDEVMQARVETLMSLLADVRPAVW